MKLSELMRHSKRLKKELETDDEDILPPLWDQWLALNLHASFLRPSNGSEVRFLRDRIEEYAEFITNEPTFEFARLQAEDAISRMAVNIAEFRRAQLAERAAA